MKKILGLILLIAVTYTLPAQVQRTPAKSNADSSTTGLKSDEKRDSKKQVLRELNLTQEQRSKMKEINESGKAAKDAVESDATLSEIQRKEKLKSIKKEQFLKIQSILTEEQKIKFKELRQNREPGN